MEPRPRALRACRAESASFVEATDGGSVQSHPAADNALTPPDPHPTAYTADKLDALLDLDRWLNPLGPSLSFVQKQQVHQFVAVDGLLALQLDELFYKHLHQLGQDALRSGRISGSVDTAKLSKEEKNALPYATKDWMRPVYFEDKGTVHTWVQLDLRSDEPSLAQLRADAWREMSLARLRLRQFIIGISG
jgi:hypothetical protein